MDCDDMYTKFRDATLPTFSSTIDWALRMPPAQHALLTRVLGTKDRPYRLACEATDHDDPAQGEEGCRGCEVAELAWKKSSELRKIVDADAALDGRTATPADRAALAEAFRRAGGLDDTELRRLLSGSANFGTVALHDLVAAEVVEELWTSYSGEADRPRMGYPYAVMEPAAFKRACAMINGWIDACRERLSPAADTDERLAVTQRLAELQRDLANLTRLHALAMDRHLI